MGTLAQTHASRSMAVKKSEQQGAKFEPQVQGQAEAPTKSPWQFFDPKDDPELMDFVTAYRYSPPFLLAWAFGVMSDEYLFFALFLMGMPLMRDKLVECLGGRGAWAKKQAEAAPAPAGK